MCLFAGLLERVPSAHAYTQDVLARGDQVRLDHGALRTVRWFGLGALPPGEVAITRILKPLGFHLHGVFPLDRLNMTGRSYAHLDDPENISTAIVDDDDSQIIRQMLIHQRVGIIKKRKIASNYCR